MNIFVSQTERRWREVAPGVGLGDYLWAPPGTAHDGDAEEETMFFVVLLAGLRVGPFSPEASIGAPGTVQP